MKVTQNSVFDAKNNNITYYNYFYDCSKSAISMTVPYPTDGIINTGIMDNNVAYVVTKDSLTVYQDIKILLEHEIDEYAYFNHYAIVFTHDGKAKVLLMKSPDEKEFSLVELKITEPKIVSSNKFGVILKDIEDYLYLISIKEDEIRMNKFNSQAGTSKYIAGCNFMIKDDSILLEQEKEKKLFGYYVGDKIFTILGKNNFHHYSFNDYKKQEFASDTFEIVTENRWEFHDGHLFVYLKNFDDYVYGGSSSAIPEKTRSMFTIYSAGIAYFFVINNEGHLIEVTIPENVTLVTQMKTKKYQLNGETFICEDVIEPFQNCFMLLSAGRYYRLRVRSGKCYLTDIEKEKDNVIDKPAVQQFLDDNHIEKEISFNVNRSPQEWLPILANFNKINVGEKNMTGDIYERVIKWMSKNFDFLDKLSPFQPSNLKEIKELDIEFIVAHYRNIKLFIEDMVVVALNYLRIYKKLPFKIADKFFENECEGLDVIVHKKINDLLLGMNIKTQKYLINTDHTL